MNEQLQVKRVDGLVIAQLRGLPTEALLRQCQEQVVNLVGHSKDAGVLYDTLQMQAPHVDIPWFQRELDEALGSMNLRRAIVVPDSKLAYLARLAFGEGDYRVFYGDIFAASNWLKESGLRKAARPHSRRRLSLTSAIDDPREQCMDYTWHFSEQDIDWHELSELYRIAPLGEKHPDNLRQVFGNSMFQVFVRHHGRLVGAGRALADGRDCSYLCDVAVHPQHQGRGLGRAIVAKLIELSSGHNKIMLYSAPGKEAFYKQLGFQRLTTGMAIFEDPEQALAERLVEES